MIKATNISLRRGLCKLAAGLALALAVPAAAQVQAVDPDRGIDADLVKPQAAAAPAAAATPAATAASPVSATVSTATEPGFGTVPAGAPVSGADPATAAAQAATQPTAAPAGATYHQDDLIGAAEGVFGKGAHGLADVIKDILAKQGEPNAYIVGREGGAALGIGLRYGSGTLYHKVEGQKPAYWTGPSIGFDAGANAGSAFVLVYNLYNTDDLYKRFVAGEGQAYLVGGFHVSYLRHGDIVLIPVRSGVGLRLGVNAGYMKLSRHQRWLPF